MLKNRLTVIVREGSTCSAKQLGDISLDQAKSVIILSTGEHEASVNSHMIKTLIQVAQMMESEDSTSAQQSVAEVEEDQTLALVDKIIKHKMRGGAGAISCPCR